jgi:hypothetical protein
MGRLYDIVSRLLTMSWWKRRCWSPALITLTMFDLCNNLKYYLCDYCQLIIFCIRINMWSYCEQTVLYILIYLYFVAVSSIGWGNRKKTTDKLSMFMYDIQITRNRRCRDRMVVGFTTIYAISELPLKLWVLIPHMPGILNTTLCDKVCQW